MIGTMQTLFWRRATEIPAGTGYSSSKSTAGCIIRMDIDQRGCMLTAQPVYRSLRYEQYDRASARVICVAGGRICLTKPDIKFKIEQGNRGHSSAGRAQRSQR